jgi:UDP-2,4-diacetamido-2,4,6-trideoxy-beta-L-altropyranose hydrolase
MDIAILAHGGPDIGYGHLVRTSALATEFLSHDWTVTYLSRTPDAAADIAPDGAGIRTVENMKDVLSLGVTDDLDVLLVDTYEVDTDDQQRARASVPQCVLVSDEAETVCCDVLVNGNVYAPNLDYDWIGEEPEWCLGTDHLLMRESFQERAARDPPWRDPPERALVIMGGSDINNQTPDVMEAFAGYDVDVDVVIGPGFTNRERIETVARETDASFDLIETPEDLPDRMFAADFAVTATGSTVYELLATQTPIIGFPQADNQIPIAEKLEQRGALLRPGDDALRTCIDQLITDEQCRRRLRENGADLVDGNGTQRVYDTITHANSSRR